MNLNLSRNCGIKRVIVAGSALLALASIALPQRAGAQYGRQDGNGNRIPYGRGRNNPQGQQGRQQGGFSTARITFDWDLNGFTVRNQSALEAQIRRDLEADAASRLQGGTTGRYGKDSRYTRSGGTNGTLGTLEVNVAFKRLNRSTVQAEVRLGLNQDGRGAAGVTATESATTNSTDNSMDGQVVLQAFRKVRREFTTKVDQYQRSNSTGNRTDAGNGSGYGNRRRNPR